MNSNKRVSFRPAEMAQWLRALVALAEVLSSVPSTCIGWLTIHTNKRKINL